MTLNKNIKTILLALVVVLIAAAILIAVRLSQADDEPQAGSAEESAASAEPTPLPTPEVPAAEAGSYGVTSVTGVMTAPGETGDGEPDGSRLILLADGTGTYVFGRRAQTFTWQQCGAMIAVYPDGSDETLAGAYNAEDGTITLRMSSGTHIFTLGAQPVGGTDGDEDEDDNEDDGEDEYTQNIFGADEPEYIEDGSAADLLDMGDYGAASYTDASGREKQIDGDLITLLTAEPDSREEVAVNGRGAFISADEYVLFRYDYCYDGTFTAYFSQGNLPDWIGEFRDVIFTGTLEDGILTLSCGDSRRYVFEYGVTPEQENAYRYTYDNKYDGELGVYW